MKIAHIIFCRLIIYIRCTALAFKQTPSTDQCQIFNTSRHSGRTNCLAKLQGLVLKAKSKYQAEQYCIQACSIQLFPGDLILIEVNLIEKCTKDKGQNSVNQVITLWLEVCTTTHTMFEIQIAKIMLQLQKKRHHLIVTDNLQSFNTSLVLINMQILQNPFINIFTQLQSLCI